MTTAWDPWNYRETVTRTSETEIGLVGYQVHATDGDIGKVDETSDELGANGIVVDTGPWIFGRKVVLPAGTIERIDDEEQKVYVDLTKDEIKDSPELEEDGAFDAPHRERLGSYYGGLYS